ncbi:hypothetical protein NHX12_013361 [Muraenolepis orangiensis]|uniref:Olfactomedin-like domain-containing protein n=1 Tax=Muraenolepis orangiensis TaxID=630683 RepID=A0A9Q0DH98_9TELE|nr:hypothetical protein NHX12_013361 [Muraenolepis orangiensis]
MRLVVVLLVCVAWASTGAQHYYQGLIDYLENRLLAIEDRMDLVDAAVRAERAERELDHLEGATSPRACAHPADKVLELGSLVRNGEVDCVDVISSIRSVKILARAGGSKGAWLRDPRSSQVYVFNGTAGDTVRQLDSLLDLSAASGINRSGGGGGGRDVRLPSPWSGPGVAVYDDYLYYVRATGSDSRELRVVKYDLLKGVVADAALLPVDGPAPVYALNPGPQADLAVDEQALWLLYAVGEDEPSIHLAQMDPVTLDIEQTWDTRCPRRNAEAAFVACGTAYVVYNTRPASRSRVQCVFDAGAGGEAVDDGEAPLFYFPRRYGAHASLKYNAVERQLYGWDDGYQILYRLNTQRNLRRGGG